MWRPLGEAMPYGWNESVSLVESRGYLPAFFVADKSHNKNIFSNFDGDWRIDAGCH